MTSPTPPIASAALLGLHIAEHCTWTIEAGWEMESRGLLPLPDEAWRTLRGLIEARRQARADHFMAANLQSNERETEFERLEAPSIDFYANVIADFLRELGVPD